VAPDVMGGSWGPGGSYVPQYIPTATDAANILSQFPGLNVIRFALDSGCCPLETATHAITVSQVDSFIQYMTSHNVVVIVEDHSGSSSTTPNVPTGTALTNEDAWYQTYANAYKNNPYVWFGTMNEPHDTTNNYINEAQQMVANYNAIRATGDNAPVLLECEWGNNTNVATSYPSDWSPMTNVIWDLHFYGGHAATTDQTTFNNAVATKINALQSVTSVDGVIPVFIGEYGPSISGGTWDSNYNTDIYAIQQGIASMITGSTGWDWSENYGSARYGDTMSTLPASPGAMTTLNPWGQEMATYISTGVTTAF
jgi:mannan endo-1,4-beta-mannosidase